MATYSEQILQRDFGRYLSPQELEAQGVDPGKYFERDGNGEWDFIATTPKKVHGPADYKEIIKGAGAIYSPDELQARGIDPGKYYEIGPNGEIGDVTPETANLLHKVRTFSQENWGSHGLSFDDYMNLDVEAQASLPESQRSEAFKQFMAHRGSVDGSIGGDMARTVATLASVYGGGQLLSGALAAAAGSTAASTAASSAGLSGSLAADYAAGLALETGLASGATGAGAAAGAAGGAGLGSSIIDALKNIPGVSSVIEALTPGAATTGAELTLPSLKTLGTVGSLAGTASSLLGDGDENSFDNGAMADILKTGLDTENSFDTGAMADILKTGLDTENSFDTGALAKILKTAVSGDGGKNTSALGGLLKSLLGVDVSDKTLDLIGKGLGLGLGAYGANQQADATKDLYEKYFQMGAPYRTSLAALEANPSGFYQSPIFQGALQQGSDALSRSLSAKVGNPILNPTALQEMQNYTTRGSLDAYNNRFAQLAGAGQLGVSQAASLGTNAAAAQGGTSNALGAGLQSLFGNQPDYAQQLLDIMKERNSLGGYRLA